MTDTDHVILTRFNLPSQGVESLVRAREGWLRDRIALFERYTVPSVAAQTNRDVHWIVYLDPESPAWLLERIQRYADRGLLRPILRATVSDDELVGDIRETLGTPARHLLTSNLDNDDGLASDYSERLLAVSSPRGRAAIYLTRGLVQGGGRIFLNRDRKNAFVAVRETWDEPPVTCWVDYHNALGRHMPTVAVGGAPAWLQVVHGANVSNRVRGRLVAPTQYQPAFAAPLDGAVPTRAETVQDRLLGNPLRQVRDSGRALLRSQGLRLLGKERYDRMKLAVSRVGRTA